MANTGGYECRLREWRMAKYDGGSYPLQQQSDRIRIHSTKTMIYVVLTATVSVPMEEVEA